MPTKGQPETPKLAVFKKIYAVVQRFLVVLDQGKGCSFENDFNLKLLSAL